MKQLLYSFLFTLMPFVLTAQNVGIGTVTPINKLDVIGGAARTGTHPNNRPFYVTGNMLADTLGIEFRHDNGTQGIGFGFNTLYATGSNTNQDLGMKAKGPSGNLFFSTNGLMRVLVNYNGNVGIGVSNPLASLDVVRGIGVEGTVRFQGTTHNSHFNYATAENTFIRGGKAGSHVLINDIAGLGNVGIGTNAPAQKLHVEGKAYVKDSVGIGITTPHAQLQLSNAVGNRKIVLYEVGNNAHQFFGFGVEASGNLRYQVPVNVNDHIFYAAASATASNELMRITGGGNVGIGASIPLHKLHVAGNTYVSGSIGIGTSTINFPLSFANSTGDKISLWGTSANHFGLGIGPSMLQIHTDAASSDIGFGYGSSSSFTELMRIKGNGNVLIGTTTGATGYKLSVKGKIAAEEILVDLHADWPDYVFEESYPLKTVDQLRTFIEEHNHLPGVPAAKQISDEGISLGEMNRVLMEKIEELTLYMLQQEERIQQLEKSINAK